MAASRTFFASDPRVHREEEWTLSRTASNQQAAQRKAERPRQDDDNTGRSSIDGAPPSASPTVLHQRFVFPDPVAFRYLEEEPDTVVLERRGLLRGYQLYLVEQWACSRTHPTFVITTYTGDPNDIVFVGVLGVEGDKTSWSRRLHTYFDAVHQFHARPKETPLGMLMVTNLSGFPSALTVIPVPDGDIKKHREDFVVNEDLKRLGCSGRSGLTLVEPSGATQAKFQQLYKTSDRIDLYKAVIEIVKLCQVALVMFDKLGQEYADGLLCDITERAINDWWTELGIEHYNIEPADGILGPTTVAALLGMFMGARNRLDYYGAPVGKDAFDIQNLKRGIYYFQKSQKLERTRRLDRPTIACLRRCTAKAAAGEGWAVRKAVKSTVAELGGKGGEMVMGMVGGRDKGKIADVETIDIDRFAELVYGDRAKWLWHGKHRSGTGDGFDKPLPDSGNLIFSKDESGAYLWSTKNRELASIEHEEDVKGKEVLNHDYQGGPPISETSIAGSPGAADQGQRKTVLKSVSGKMSDARSGLGRIKDAVGLRGHVTRHSKDDIMGGYNSTNDYLTPNTANLTLNGSLSAHPGGLEKSFSWKNRPLEYENGHPKISHPVILHSNLSPYNSRNSLPSSSDSIKAPEHPRSKDGPEQRPPEEHRETPPGSPINPSVAAEKTFDAVTKAELKGTTRTLYRRRSTQGLPLMENRMHSEAWWPRHLSFSDVSDAVLPWQDINASDGSNLMAPVAESEWRYLQEEEGRLFARIQQLQLYLTEWVERKISNVERVEGQAVADQDVLQEIYNQLSEDYRDIQARSQDIIVEERTQLLENIEHVKGLGAKLDYQINVLNSKVLDVEESIHNFESLVVSLEAQADDMEVHLQTETWLHWAVRTLTGIGHGPHTE